MLMAKLEGFRPENRELQNLLQPKRNGRNDLVAEAGADGYALAARGTAAAQYGSACLGLHA
jgi:hypothetical protein